MNKEYFVPGVIPSPPDNRDFTIAMARRVLGRESVKSYPEKIRIPYPGPVYDQGNIGACVAYSLIAERLTSEWLQRKVIEHFSPGFIYGNRYWSFYKGEGMITRDALDSLRIDGAVLYEDFPYIDRYEKLKDIIAPHLEILRKKTAKPYRISSYFRLDGPGQDVIENMKEALMNGMLIVTCIDVYESFFSAGKDGLVPIPDTTKEKNYGGHAMLTLGMDDTLGDFGATDTLNSWGPDWGDNGWCHLPYNYPFKEVWAVSDTIDANLVKLQQQFEDADEIAPWAREYVVKATKLGLMSGDGVVFAPKGNLTREQAAVITVKLYEKITEELKR